MSARMAAICSGVAGAEELPMTRLRTVPKPVRAYVLVPNPSRCAESRTCFTSSGPRPSAPSTTVVMPCMRLERLRRRSSLSRGNPSYACVCGSMKPGVMICPRASIRCRATTSAGTAPTNTMRSALMPTAPSRGALPRPSYTRPPVMSTSSVSDRAPCAASDVDEMIDEVARQTDAADARLWCRKT